MTLILVCSYKTFFVAQLSMSQTCQSEQTSRGEHLVVIIKLDVNKTHDSPSVRGYGICKKAREEEYIGSALQAWLDERYTHAPWNPLVDARLDIEKEVCTEKVL
jgi:hypothetical protein